MAYYQEVERYMVPYIALATTTAGVLREMDIGDTAADHGEMLVVRRCCVKRLQFTMVGELAGGTGTAPTVIFTRRVTPLSSTGEVVIGTVTIPDATAVGKTVFKDVDPVILEVGDTVEISHTVGIGTPTGLGVWSMIVDPSPEDARNEADMVESV